MSQEHQGISIGSQSFLFSKIKDKKISELTKIAGIYQNVSNRIVVHSRMPGGARRWFYRINSFSMAFGLEWYNLKLWQIILFNIKSKAFLLNVNVNVNVNLNVNFHFILYILSKYFFINFIRLWIKEIRNLKKAIKIPKNRFIILDLVKVNKILRIKKIIFINNWQRYKHLDYQTWEIHVF